MTTKNFNRMGKIITKILTLISVFSFGGMVDNTIEFFTIEGLLITITLGIIASLSVVAEYIVNRMTTEKEGK